MRILNNDYLRVAAAVALGAVAMHGVNENEKTKELSEECVAGIRRVLADEECEERENGVLTYRYCDSGMLSVQSYVGDDFKRQSIELANGVDNCAVVVTLYGGWNTLGVDRKYLTEKEYHRTYFFDGLNSKPKDIAGKVEGMIE